MAEHLSLADAVSTHVRPGDSLQIFCGHSRWNALAREVVRQFWGTDPGFELQALLCGNLGTLFVHGGLLRKLVSTYIGDGFPTAAPNPIYANAVNAGLEVEHWSILTYQQRNEAAARGLPAMVTGSLAGTSMADNEAYTAVATPHGEVGLVAPMHCDVFLLHAAVADRHGNVALTGPLMEGLWAGWAARRGTLVTVEKIVDDLSDWNTSVRLPAHRVLAVVEAPFGAHPGGVFAGDLPVDGYGEDIPFWNSVAQASRGDFDAWIREWVLDVPSQGAWNAKLGTERLDWLRGRADPESWRADDAAHPVDLDAPITRQEIAAVVTARELATRAIAMKADAILAGAGLSNLAAWAGAALAREHGHDVRLTAEMGLWGYDPTPADPYIFNHRVFPGTEMLNDCSSVLGMIVRGPGTTTLACMSGAEVDRHGNINSTVIPGTSFLAGSGGGADVAAGADEVTLAIVASSRRLVDRCAFVTSPGDRVQTVCTDLGILRKRDGELRLAAVVEGPGSVDDRVKAAIAACGWDLATDREVVELPTPSPQEVATLRGWDRERTLLT